MKLGTLLSVGCGKYNSGGDLVFAENDAKVIHDELKESTSLYAEDQCFLIRSPTSAEFRQIVVDNAEVIRGSSVATFYFSGHGDSVNGTFYLCFRDYNSSVPSATGVTIAEILRLVSDLEIDSVNILIDACYSGQAQRDLREISENPSFDGKMCPSVNIIAASLPFQPAIGRVPLSDFTFLLVQYIRGEKDSNLPKRHISITDLGPMLAQDQASESHRQNLVFSAINLLGEIPLFENPIFSGEDVQPHSKILSPRSPLGSAVFTTKECLARAYKDVLVDFDDNSLLDAFRSICSSAEGDSEELLKLLFHYSSWFSSRLASSNDWSLRLRFSSVLAAASLPTALTNSEFRRGIVEIVRSSLCADAEILNEFVRSRSFDSIGLHAYSSLDDLYFLPVRLSAIYGRIGLILELERLDGISLLEDLSSLLQRLIDERLSSHLIFSESQAFQLYLFFQAVSERQVREVSEQIFGAYVNDHFSVCGCVLRDNADKIQVLEYLRSRHDHSKLENVSGLARPNSALPLLILVSQLFNLDSTIDPWLYSLNRSHTNIFLSNASVQFGDAIIEDGVNLHLEVGKDFYSCSEYREHIRLAQQMHGMPLIGNDLRFLLLVCIHLMPDRLILPSSL